MNTDCPHIALKLCLVGESKLYKCLECKRNFNVPEPLQIKVTYPVANCTAFDPEPCGKDERCQP